MDDVAWLIEASEADTHALPPDRVVHGARHDAVEGGEDALVLRRIERLVRLDIGVALAVAVPVHHDRRPALRFRRVAGLEERLRLHPAHDAIARAGTALRKPQRLVLVLCE